MDVLVENIESLGPYEAASREKPYSVDTWVDYLDHVHDNATLHEWIGRRALQILPRSYKIWKAHWERVIAQGETDKVLACFERAVLTMGSYPRVWEVYFDYLREHVGCCNVTQLRRTVDRALTAVSVSQHGKLWPSILSIFQKEGIGSTFADETDVVIGAREDVQIVWNIPVETRATIISRYAKYNPQFLSEYCEWLIDHKLWGKAALAYQDLHNSSSATSPEIKQAFVQLITQHPVEVTEAGVPWEAMIRAQLEDDDKAKKEEPSAALPRGLLWTSLADAWVRQGLFDEARSVYAEGLEKVSTVRDFGIVYQAYLALEEGLLEAAVNAVENMDEGDDDAENSKDEDDWDLLLPSTSKSGQVGASLTDMELAVARAEHLTARRPLLLNAVLLRQEPSNVGEWLERAKLYGDDHNSAVAALRTALGKVWPRRAVNGTPNEIVTRLATIYEEQFSLEEANEFLHDVCLKHSYAFNKTEHMAACWSCWIEMQLRHNQHDKALELARQSIASGTKNLALQKSRTLWDLLLDLEEALGEVQTTKDAYNRALETKVATVQHILNFATYLTEQKYFEESFSAYERGVEMFSFPHPGAKLIWKAYLDAFDKRYQGSKVERSRDIFQRCIEACPAEHVAEFCLMNGSFEEEHGLTKRALDVYKQMSAKVQKGERLMAYQIYIAKTAKYLGVTATRAIYQEAIEHLEEKDAAKLCIEFAAMEASLQQPDRARAIYAYGAKMADPRRLPEFYKDWNDFEIVNGNEETFREMLRIKRSVEASFSTVNYSASGMSERLPNLSNEEAMTMIAAREGDELEAAPVTGFVSSRGDAISGSKRTAAAASLDDVEARVAKLRSVTGAAATGNKDAAAGDTNDDADDEIDIDDIDAEIEAAAAEGS